jgi:hypothetical protein
VIPPTSRYSGGNINASARIEPGSLLKHLGLLHIFENHWIVARAKIERIVDALTRVTKDLSTCLFAEYRLRLHVLAI